jgi:hypothetical protein
VGPHSCFACSTEGQAPHTRCQRLKRSVAVLTLRRCPGSSRFFVIVGDSHCCREENVLKHAALLLTETATLASEIKGNAISVCVCPSVPRYTQGLSKCVGTDSRPNTKLLFHFATTKRSQRQFVVVIQAEHRYLTDVSK